FSGPPRPSPPRQTFPRPPSAPLPPPLLPVHRAHTLHTPPLKDSPIGPHTHRAQTHVQVGKCDREETAPGPILVTPIETTDAIVGALADRGAGEPVAESANQMAQRMASEGVAAQQGHVRQQHQRADADAEAAVKPKRLPDVVGQQEDEDQREVEEVSMDILQDQRKGALAEITRARLADRAGGRVRPKSLV